MAGWGEARHVSFGSVAERLAGDELAAASREFLEALGLLLERTTGRRRDEARAAGERLEKALQRWDRVRAWPDPLGDMHRAARATGGSTDYTTIARESQELVDRLRRN